MGGVGEPPGTTGDAGDRDMGEGYGWGGGVRLGRQAMRAIGIWGKVMGGVGESAWDDRRCGR